MKRKYFKKRYPFRCPVCHKEGYASPSIFMVDFGMNRGTKPCPWCHTDLTLKITKGMFGEFMKAKIRDKRYINPISHEAAIRYCQRLGKN